ncbi:uncharacterized protein LOC110620292 isoform X3 [Manihot esculenta]|uniref:uncharacterized protein LOC110620292 isoform X3 n=1 Tax=Manihot esculenta TaxID=3983 RepID=UPI000B5D5F4D|nr:uncharacterized protein LOC110620292 isoform X3 [Manihot esculenta]
MVSQLLSSVSPSKTMTDFVHSLPCMSSLSSLIVQPLKLQQNSLTSATFSSSSSKSSTLICSSKPNNGRAPMDGGRPVSRNRKKSSYGTSRRSILKKSFTQEQVNFSFPVTHDPHVGIIGGGMAGLVCALSLEKRGIKSTVFDTTRMVSVVRPCWISRLEPFNGMWHLSENGKPCGQFDVIVIAHNGKCANRLLASSGLPLIARQMKKLELSSIWALLAAFEDPLTIPSGAPPFEGAFVKGVDSVSWMGNNTMKLFSENNSPHCWTIFSTAAFGKKNKVPQENIPRATAEKVETAMLEGVEAALGLPKGSLQKPFYSRVQLWGAALPTNSPGIPCIFDPNGRAGICGDWLLGSNLESAALSGMALANHIGDYLQSCGGRPEEFAVGLDNEFHSIEGHDIGQFSGLDMESKQLQHFN